MNDIERAEEFINVHRFFSLSPEVHVHNSSSSLGIPSCVSTRCLELIMLQSQLCSFPYVCFFPMVRLRDTMGSFQMEVRNFGVFSCSYFFLIPAFHSKPLTVSTNLQPHIAFPRLMFLFLLSSVLCHPDGISTL